ASVSVPAAGPAAAASVDPDLFAYLREWRGKVAVRENVPAYVILHDTSVHDLCCKRPASLEELVHVTGIGERKAERYGAEILAALKDFKNGARAAARNESG